MLSATVTREMLMGPREVGPVVIPTLQRRGLRFQEGACLVARAGAQTGRLPGSGLYRPRGAEKRRWVHVPRDPLHSTGA